MSKGEGAAGAPRVRLSQIGREGEPVVVIDQASPDPDALVSDAAASEFTIQSPYYPGVRALTPPTYWRSLESLITPILQEHFGYRGAPRVLDCVYSIVTRAPRDLGPIQRLPHFDSLDPKRVAVLHYLGPPNLGGTSFYRHRATGFETLSQARYPAYGAALTEDIRRHGAPEPRYMSGDTPLYERVASFEAAFNRILVYRGVTLHSGDVPNDATLSSDPRLGRLTVNAFLTEEPPA